MDSALYAGTLRHRRFSPRTHSFEYPVFLSFLDIDEIPGLMARSRLSSYERWNVLSYFERDHFGDPRKQLRARLQEDAMRQGVSFPDGKIFLLTHLRYFGYVFNPVSFFYFYDRAGQLIQMMAEVNNTFGESCNYWLTPENRVAANAGLHYKSEKRMHVSPFMAMDIAYDWVFTEPGEKMVAHMNTVQDGKAFFDATLSLRHREWNAAELRRVLATYPLMTTRVIAGIHWEALKLWIKHVPVFAHPAKVRPEQAPTQDAPVSTTKGSYPG